MRGISVGTHIGIARVEIENNDKRGNTVLRDI